MILNINYLILYSNTSLNVVDQKQDEMIRFYKQKYSYAREQIKMSDRFII